MSGTIVDEVMFLLDSFFLGAVITCIYDGFLILRRLIRHNMLFISLEDLIFWIVCAIGVFGVLYEENNGTLRWFAVVGAALGMLVYKKTLSPFVIRVITKALRGILRGLWAVIRFILTPFAFLLKKAGTGARGIKRRGGRFIKYMKKKLTACKKLLNIILSKH